MRKHVAALQKRRDWLQARVAINDDRGRNLSYDKSELAALEWALDILGELFT